MSIAICWFRQDLRLSDNPALVAASTVGKVLPVYILDDVNAGDCKMGAASRVWLYHSLASLNDSLDGKLKLFLGDARKIIPQIAHKFGVSKVCWNYCYEPWRIKRDAGIKQKLVDNGIDVEIFNGSLLAQPWETLKDNGQPYKVFTPFYKKHYFNEKFREPLDKPPSLKLVDIDIESTSLQSLGLLSGVKWSKDIIKGWDISEKGASNCLHSFIDNGMKNYKKGRDFPALASNSRLSPYLHFGQISPNQIWHSVGFYEADENINNFFTELAWREFSYNLLYHFPSLPSKNMQSKFDTFPWQSDRKMLDSWHLGQTGYPIVDAGMRELWQTGFMHNRVRMIVGSFLVKNMLTHWREGAKWFWDCLFDADLANNSASWQWVAGCGADAAPYFRIFNPVTQGQKFDALGEYTRKYVPELSNMPDKYLFNPWEAPQSIMDEAGVRLGENYPHPIVDLKKSRQYALKCYNANSKVVE